MTPKLPCGLNTFAVYTPHRGANMVEERFNILGKSKVFQRQSLIVSCTVHHSVHVDVKICNFNNLVTWWLNRNNIRVTPSTVMYYTLAH
jgi:hypothetical protein